MQHAILLICFASSFANISKVLLLEDENTGGCRLGICSNSPYNVGKALSEREQVAIGKLPEYQVLTLKIQIYRLCRISHSRIPFKDFKSPGPGTVIRVTFTFEKLMYNNISDLTTRVRQQGAACSMGLI